MVKVVEPIPKEVEATQTRQRLVDIATTIRALRTEARLLLGRDNYDAMMGLIPEGRHWRDRLVKLERARTAMKREVRALREKNLKLEYYNARLIEENDALMDALGARRGR
jgi:hypothetical protein